MTFQMILVLLLVVCIAVSGSLSSSETSLFSLSSLKVRSFKRRKDPRYQRIHKLLSRPQDLLVTILILNVASNILAQNVVSSIFSNFPGWLLSVGVPLVLTLVFGEVIPKSLAISNNEAIALRVSTPLMVIRKIIGPVRRAMTIVTSAVSRFFFFFLRKEDEISGDEIKHALLTSQDSGVVGKEEANLIHGYLDLEDLTAKEIMQPRQDVIYHLKEDGLDKLTYLFVDQECSRIPVCDESLENVLGIITAKRYFLEKNNIKDDEGLIPHLQKPFFVPETVGVKHLLRQMNETSEVFALVVDEYNSVCGIVTREDLSEVVIGEVEDKRSEHSQFTRQGKDTIIASGKLELTELEELFDLKLVSENNYATIGGWLLEQLGEIPSAGKKLQKDGFFFQILTAGPNRIKTVFIKKLDNRRVL